MSHQYGSLACQSVRWIGIHPSDLEPNALQTPRIPLTPSELAKLNSIQSRPYVDECFSRELDIMRKGKAEIEAIGNDSFISHYLGEKIRNNDFI